MTLAPLVMICGVGSDADSWHDPLVALGGRAVVPRGNSIEAMARDLLALLPERVSIAGHSMGGYVALAMQRIAPERVVRIAIVNSCAAPDDAERIRGRKALIDAIEKRGIDALADGLSKPVTDDPALRIRVAAMFRRAGADRVVREQRACATRADAHPALPSIAVPALIVGSADDALMPPGSSQAMAAAITGSKLVMFANGGHVTPMAHARETTRLMREWLARPTG